MRIILKNEAGIAKEVKVGFSWTTFFFGFFVPLFRGDLKWFAIMFIISLILGGPSYGTGITLVSFIMSFIYNRLYIGDLYKNGYRPVDPNYDDVILNYIN